MTAKGFDIAIIGGGIIGLTLARALCERDAEIAVFDAGGAIPPATHAAAGMLAPSFELGEYPARASKALYALGARGLSLWADYAAALEEETGVFVDYRGTGALGVAYGDGQTGLLAEQAEIVTALGGKAEMISGDEVRAMEPALSEEIVSALYAPRDAQVDPRRVMTALRASLLARGVDIIPARVISLGEGDAAHQFVSAEGDAFEAETIILASGAVSGLIPMGMVFPVKGEATAIASEGVLTRLVRAPGAYLCPKAEGRLVIGATEEIGPLNHQSVSAVAIAGLRANAVRAAPSLEGAPERERWAGLRPGTPDGAPIMGREQNGRFLALGHYRNGILHAPAVAQAMAAEVLEAAAPFDLGPFSPDRFTPGQVG